MRLSIVAKTALVVLALTSCGGNTLDPNGDGSNGGNGRKGKLRLLVTDAPLQAKEVWVTMSQIEMHADTTEGWISFAPGATTIDLLKLQDGQQALLEEALLPAGKYTQIRLDVTDSWLIDMQDQRCEVKIPSSEVKLQVQFDIEADTTTRVLLDFDAAQSMKITQKGNKKECILRPVIHAVSVTTG
jgi:uncharacterized protein DUF4382